jgi:hypothetical protein
VIRGPGRRTMGRKRGEWRDQYHQQTSCRNPGHLRRGRRRDRRTGVRSRAIRREDRGRICATGSMANISTVTTRLFSTGRSG